MNSAGINKQESQRGRYQDIKTSLPLNSIFKSSQQVKLLMQIHWISALYGCGLWSDGASSTKAIQYVTVKDSFITAALKIGTSMDLSMEEQLQLKMSNH